MSLEDRVLTVAEAAELLRVSPRTLYGAIARGEVYACHVGRRIVVPGASLERMLGREPAPRLSESKLRVVT